MRKPRIMKLSHKRRTERSAGREERGPVRPEGIPPGAIYIDDNNWIMPDALRLAQIIEINQILSDRPVTFRRVDGGDDTTPPDQWKWERVTKKRDRPVGSKNRAKAAAA
jgi:hypothetical protein